MQITKKIVMSCVTAGVLVLANTVWAKSAELLTVNVNAHEWVDATEGPAGAKVDNLVSDPNKGGLFVLRAKLPANFKFPLHSYSDNRYITVISGSLHLSFDDKKVANQDRTLTAGGFAAIPAHTKYSSWTTEETIVQVGGIGPSKLVDEKISKVQKKH